jgi:hypothetical protein
MAESVKLEQCHARSKQQKLPSVRAEKDVVYSQVSIKLKPINGGYSVATGPTDTIRTSSKIHKPPSDARAFSGKGSLAVAGIGPH